MQLECEQSWSIAHILMPVWLCSSCCALWHGQGISGFIINAADADADVVADIDADVDADSEIDADADAYAYVVPSRCCQNQQQQVRAMQVYNYPVVNHGRVRGLLQRLRSRMLNLQGERAALQQQLADLPLDTEDSQAPLRSRVNPSHLALLALGPPPPLLDVAGFGCHGSCFMLQLAVCYISTNMAAVALAKCPETAVCPSSSHTVHQELICTHGRQMARTIFDSTTCRQVFTLSQRFRMLSQDYMRINESYTQGRHYARKLTVARLQPAVTRLQLRWAKAAERLVKNRK